LIRRSACPTEIIYEKTKGSTDYEIHRSETKLEYDENNNLSKELHWKDEHNYSISKYTKDTLHLNIISSPNMYEYLYNTDNQKIKRFHQVDSLRFLRTKSYD